MVHHSAQVRDHECTLIQDAWEAVVAGLRLLRLQGGEEYPVAVLHPLVERLRLPGANAWSLNVVFSQPRGVQRAGCATLPCCCGLSAFCCILLRVGMQK